MRLGLVVRVNVVVGWFAAASTLLAACGESSSNGSRDRDQYEPPARPICTPGRSCSCSGGRTGTLQCEGDLGTCECEACDALEVTEAPSVKPCGGEPFGTWRLTDLEGGRSKLALTVGGRSAGTCDMMMTRVGLELPRVLMSLHEGGEAEYFAESGPLSLAYSESCVVGKAPSLSCGAKAWTGVSDCNLDCDICRCQTTTAMTSPSRATTWQRTQTALTAAPFGTGTDFAYCASDTKLELSAEGLYLEFERVYELDAPSACEERTPTTCLLGENDCSLGACVGGASCANATTEGNCLTVSGCSWDADACIGDAWSGCRLQDYGVVPGCELTTTAQSCQGKPLPCAERAIADCSGGCTLNEAGRCAGGSLSCENFDFCPDQCDVDCAGQVDCSLFDEYSCPLSGVDYYGDACEWQDSFCTGQPTLCETLSNDECDLVAGCALAESP